MFPAKERYGAEVREAGLGTALFPQWFSLVTWLFPAKARYGAEVREAGLGLTPRPTLREARGSAALTGVVASVLYCLSSWVVG